eukprot:52553-Pelagomonas_calceolata.AAC.1
MLGSGSHPGLNAREQPPQIVITKSDTPHPQNDVLDFVRVWEQLDPYGTSYIDVRQLTTLITTVGAPMD